MQRQQGSCKPNFARHVSDGLLDLRALRMKMEAVGSAIDARLAILQRDVETHELALAGMQTTMCRNYRRSDPTCSALHGKTPSGGSLSA